jgi:integrase
MMSLHDQQGGRKYLTRDEHIRFLLAADQAPRDVRAFCHTLGWSGCRISEALALTAERVDVAAGSITFETLKKRRTGVFRTVPIPPELAIMLDLVFGLRGLKGAAAKLPLWTWSRATAWRRIKEVLAAAGIEGAQASPKGLRHAMGVAAVGQGIPLNLVQRWMGHAQLTTTAIYAEAVGEEERSIAARMWR